jgi:hypothetical protein
MWRVRGVIEGCYIFWGQKLAKTYSSVGGRIVVQQVKNLESRTQLDEPAECASRGDPVLLYKILYLLFPLLAGILCSLRLESRKNYQYGFDAELLELQFLRPRGGLTNPFRTLSLCFEVID